MNWSKITRPQLTLPALPPDDGGRYTRADLTRDDVLGVGESRYRMPRKRARIVAAVGVFCVAATFVMISNMPGDLYWLALIPAIALLPLLYVGFLLPAKRAGRAFLETTHATHPSGQSPPWSSPSSQNHIPPKEARKEGADV